MEILSAYDSASLYGEMRYGQARRRELELARELIKPRRADALRNEGKIVEIALSQFAAQGVDAPLDAIAKEAGVGAGTLYRHFPTRDDLISSALGKCTIELEKTQESLMESADDLTALQEWLGVVRSYVRTFNGLATLLLHAANNPSSALSLRCTEMQDITAHFLQRAQQAGVARPNVSAKDLFIAQLALSCVEDYASSSTEAASLESLLRKGYAAPAPTPK